MIDEYVPGLEGIPATKSAISALDGDKGILSYRGYRIEDLAKESTFEEVSYLLLKGELPKVDELTLFSEQLHQGSRVKYNVREIMKFLPPTGDPMKMLQTAVASLGMFYPHAQQNSELATKNNDYINCLSLEIIARMSTLVAMWEQMRRGDDPFLPREDLSYAANFLYMMSGKEPDPVAEKIMDTSLVLHAEHTINASTFAAMVAGSTLANPSLVISAAIGTLAGPLHGGANQRVIEMLQEIGEPSNAVAWLDRRLKNKQVVWGMGHREYSIKDPRATILEGLMQELIESKDGKVSPLFETALALEKACEVRLAPKGVFPNVDFYSGILYREMGIPGDQFTPIFAISRTVGWLAHWQEQVRENRIFRPTQIYVGAELRAFTPTSDR